MSSEPDTEYKWLFPEITHKIFNIAQVLKVLCAIEGIDFQLIPEVTSIYFPFIQFFLFSLFLPAPCPPSQVQATLNCDENRALVSWLSSHFPGSYTASMVDQSKSLLNCSTMNSSCWVPSLKCGQVYVVSVTYYNGMCRSRPSLPIQMNSSESRATVCILCFSFNQNLTMTCKFSLKWRLW